MTTRLEGTSRRVTGPPEAVLTSAPCTLWRGTAEQWIKEGKQAVKMTRLSCNRFRSNEMRLWLSVIAYNLGNLWRRLFGSMVRCIEGLTVLAG